VKNPSLSHDEALALVLARSAPLPPEPVSFLSALGRVPAEDVLAEGDDPPAPRSAMDGYALRAADTAAATPAHPTAFTFAEVVGAGHLARGAVGPGTAVRLMTGAWLPAGADAVVKQEDTRAAGDGRFTLARPLEPGENVIPAGARYRQGDRLLAAGHPVGPGAHGVLASMGRTRLRVHGRPRVALLALGDELAEVGERLRPGQLYVSNLYALEALAARYGAETRRLGIAGDDPALIERLLRPRLLAPGAPPSPLGCEVVVTLGGSHAGDFDFVDDVLEALGARLHFRRTRMVPGGSTLFATLGGTLLFGLPGTPVAAWVAFETLVRPALWRLAGRATLEHPPLGAVLTAPVAAARNRTGFVPVWLSFSPGGPPQASPLREGPQGDLPPAALANGLLRCAEGAGTLAAGDSVTVAWLGA